ncbi:acyltransferase family protein [Zestomonas thermotolerans]|uniref:acyltransferase family protein n=1 Tax=Zestomonas thermotolerans TaxID=157784 RepID=UPI0023F0E305|nr:acyltransferase [Pseudomonas thermotolerans]
MTANAAPEREFRLDINGLRAWAVIAVVLYHFGVAGIGGGFAGVDVFFVISGYLMCGIVLEELERGDFSLWRFYLARARRICRALRGGPGRRLVLPDARGVSATRQACPREPDLQLQPALL